MTSDRLYGLAEIAEALGLEPTSSTIRMWYKRSKLPPAIQVLKMGPVWLAEDIEPWIKDALT